MQASTSIPCCFTRCVSLARHASSSSKPAISPRSRRVPQRALSPNSLSFSEAIKTLRSLSPGDTSSAYELTLLPRLAASVNINSLRGRTFLKHEAGNTKKKEVVVVFAEGEKADEARGEGADIVGGKELIDEVNKAYRPISTSEGAEG